MLRASNRVWPNSGALAEQGQALDSGPSNVGIDSCAWANQARLGNSSSIGHLNIEDTMKSHKGKSMPCGHTGKGSKGVL